MSQFQQRHFQLLISVIVSLYLVNVSHSLCVRKPWDPKNNTAPTCDEDYVETLTVVTRDKNNETTKVTLCCFEVSVEDILNTAKTCKTTTCLLKKEEQDDPCSTLDQYIINGTAVERVEELEDDCVDEETGKTGVSAVCCPPDSPDAILLSAYGSENNEFPHQVKILKPGHCGGTVYNKDYVITAAHCLTNEDTGEVMAPSDVELVLGTNIARLKSKSNTFHVEKVIVHESYSFRANTTERTMNRTLWRDGPFTRIFNDIALLKLNRSIDFKDPTIRALEIAPAKFVPKDHADQVAIVGWGTTDNLELSEFLNKANLIIRNNMRDCFKPLTNQSITETDLLLNRTFVFHVGYYHMAPFSDQLICIGGNINGKFSPTAGGGDSGGPAICRGKDGYAVHCGVTSFGTSDEVCRANSTLCAPSAYVSVSHFRDWIVKNAGAQDPATFHKAYLYGQKVPEGKYENQVHITSIDGKSCGGTLVSPDTVVTAAHCVKTDDKKDRPGLTIMTKVRDLKRTGKNYDGANYLVKKDGINILPRFARWTGMDALNEGRKRMLDTPYSADIAVVKLAKKVEISEKDLAKLPTSEPAPGPATEVAFPLMTTRSGEILQREFKILKSAECVRRLDRFRRLGVETSLNTTGLTCGVEKYSGGSICDRELGGGLFCKEKNGEEVLCGVQIFRMCELSLPNPFLDVYAYKDFITKFL